MPPEPNPDPWSPGAPRRVPPASADDDWQVIAPLADPPARGRAANRRGPGRRPRRDGLVLAAVVCAALVVTAGVTVAVLRGGSPPPAGVATAGATLPSAPGSPRATPTRSARAPAVPPPTPGSTLVIGTDLPFTGRDAVSAREAQAAMELHLRQVGNRAGRFRVQLRRYDNGSAGSNGWDPSLCRRNAALHTRRADEVAVVGTFNAGCSQIQVPRLGTAVGGPLLMVSHANTYPGLTRTWDAGEPRAYYPTGVRNYARVIGTDDRQGTAAAQYAVRGLRVGRCVVLDDGTVYGRGLASAFTAHLRRLGGTTVLRSRWDPAAASYVALFRRAAGARPDCVYLGGGAESNGVQLVRDKVAALGPNSRVALLAGDGFARAPRIAALPQAAGMVLSFAGLDASQITSRPGAAARFSREYVRRNGPWTSAYSLYAVSALQVVLEAVARSDGSRAGVHRAVMGGTGVTVPAARSVLGREVAIDPATGDVQRPDVTILRLVGGTERVEVSVPVFP